MSSNVLSIPHQWNDIDAMSQRKDFSFDSKTFSLLPEFVKHLHSLNMKYVPMFDPAIQLATSDPKYRPFHLGLDLNVFVKNSSDQLFIGKVWPGLTVWPDFLHPNASSYWTTLFKQFHDRLAFDGSWLDMNDPSNFFDGAINGCPDCELENPQYKWGSNSDPLRTKTLCMSAKHYSCLHYDCHNIYGLAETMTTNE